MLVSKLRSVQLREEVLAWKRENPATPAGNNSTEFCFFVQAGHEQVRIHCFGRDRNNKLRKHLQEKGWVVYGNL